MRLHACVQQVMVGGHNKEKKSFSILKHVYSRTFLFFVPKTFLRQPDALTRTKPKHLCVEYFFA
jgi:hypothetical protein